MARSRDPERGQRRHFVLDLLEYRDSEEDAGERERERGALLEGYMNEWMCRHRHHLFWCGVVAEEDAAASSARTFSERYRADLLRVDDGVTPR